MSLAIALVCIGIGMLAVGHLVILVEAFSESLLWILVAFSPAWLLFVLVFWDKCKNYLLIQLCGIVLVIVGANIS